jgi:hypothetical protein
VFIFQIFKELLPAARMELQRISVALCGLRTCKVLQGFWGEEIYFP